MECAICLEEFYMIMSLEEYEAKYKTRFEDKVKVFHEEEEFLNYKKEFSKRIDIKKDEFYDMYKYMWFEGLRLKKSNNLNPSYTCSVCNIMLCSECFSKLHHKFLYEEESDEEETDVIYQCTHCRNYDYKYFMRVNVLNNLLEKVMGKENYKKYLMEKIENSFLVEGYI
jgi:hypothetical protein